MEAGVDAMWSIYLLLGFVAVLVSASLAWRWASRRRQLPCPAWLAWMLENPFIDRQAGVQPTLDRFGVQPGERCLDVGCGPGRLSLPAARRVELAGTVVALDIQPAMLARLERRAAQTGVTNVVAQLGDIAAGADLPSDDFDRAWLFTVLGEIPDRESALRELYRVLKPGGTLSIAEVLGDPHYQSRATVLRLCRQAGFEPGEYWGNVLAFTQNLTKPAS